MDDQTLAGINRINGLLAWRGMPGVEDTDSMSNQFNRFQSFVALVQKAYLEAASRHMEAIFATNDRLAQAALALLQGQLPADLTAAQREIVTVVSEAARAHAETWAELRQKVEDSCTILSPRAAATDIKVELWVERVPAAEPERRRPVPKSEALLQAS